MLVGEPASLFYLQGLCICSSLHLSALPLSICKVHSLSVHIFARVFLAAPPPKSPSQAADAAYPPLPCPLSVAVPILIHG